MRKKHKFIDERKCRHTLQPEGFLAWHAWAKEKVKTHEQQQCENCGSWAVWVAKGKNDQ